MLVTMLIHKLVKTHSHCNNLTSISDSDGMGEEDMMGKDDIMREGW